MDLMLLIVIGVCKGVCIGLFCVVFLNDQPLIEMKRYFAFYGATCYPNGGMEDFVADYDTIEEAIGAIETAHSIQQSLYSRNWESSWGSVWDSKDRKEVYNK